VISSYQSSLETDGHDVPATQINPVPQPHLIDPNYGYFAALKQFHLGAVHIKNADHITVTNSHFQAIGTNAIYVDGYATALLISDTLIEKVALSGIHFEGPYPGEAGGPGYPASSVGSNEVYDFKINSVGELWDGASGIDFAQSGNNTVHYGLMTNGPRKAIWNYSDVDMLPANVYSCNNVVDHVKMTNWVQDSCDTGAYTNTALSATTDPSSCFNTLSQSIIDATGNGGFVTCQDIPFNPAGILDDGQAAGTVYTNVQVTNSQANPYRTQTPGGPPILTNASFNANGTVNGSFNAGLMDTANIGTKPTFPYP